MTGSSHHEIGKWLAGLLQLVLEWFLSHCISDSFTFAKTMQNLTSMLNIMKKSYFLKRRNLQHTSDMLTIRLLSSITNLKQMNS